MGFFSDLKQAIHNLALMGEWADQERTRRIERMAVERDYYEGAHRRQIRVKTGQADDNMALNFVGLVVDRGISMLLGSGIEFDMPGETEGEDGQEVDQPNQQYIDEVWKANRKDITLHKAAQFAAWHGTGYIKIQPEGVESRDNDGKLLPRLIPLDPAYMKIETMPEDIDTVLRYVNQYMIVLEGKERGRKQIVERNLVAVNAEGQPAAFDDKIIGFQDAGWVIIDQLQAPTGVWEEIGREAWPYEFPPVIHWQNLPLAGSIYGKPDITPDLIELQDRINFVAGNINRIIRYHAHPKTWGRNAGQTTQQTWGADEMVIFNSPDATIENLEMQSDLTSSQAFLLSLRQALFDVGRSVDISSMNDKLGALTNFGLRVLYQDALAKLGSKQELFGEVLTELNHRLLVLGGVQPADGGEVVWPDPLPENETEEIAGLGFDLLNGLVSKETVATERGYDWEEEQERIDAEREKEMENSDNIGAQILRNFERGGSPERGNRQFGNRERQE